MMIRKSEKYIDEEQTLVTFVLNILRIKHALELH